MPAVYETNHVGPTTGKDHAIQIIFDGSRSHPCRFEAYHPDGTMSYSEGWYDSRESALFAARETCLGEDAELDL